MLQHGMRQTAEAVAQMTSVERILQFTDLEREGNFKSTPDKKPSLEWPQLAEIRFERVSLRYSKTELPVLRNLNFKIDAGAKVNKIASKNSWLDVYKPILNFRWELSVAPELVNRRWSLPCSVWPIWTEQYSSTTWTPRKLDFTTWGVRSR